jgi:hypothetical protein
LAKRNSRKPSIQGIVIPSRWDDQGTVTEVTIQTFDEKAYVVERNKKGNELLNFIRKQVEISGKIRERLDGNTLISVQHFNVIDDHIQDHATPT